MKTGQFIQTIDHHLDRNIEYVTENVDQLLQSKNFKFIWNLARAEGTGTYINKFPKDMALTRSVIGYDSDSTGREIFTNNTIIIKFDSSDSLNILDILDKTLNLLTKMEKYQQNNNTPLHNPLPDIKILEMKT